MSVFQRAQYEDLRDLQAACRRLGAEVAIIGAMAYRLFVDDVERQTYDIDFAVTIELEDLPAFYALLTGLGWQRVPRQEQRWRTARGTYMDVLPAGPGLRARGRMEWPQSGLSISLAGFEHVFRDSVPVDLAPGLRCKVVPPPVLALLKMASYADDPYGRAKDLTDLRRLLRRYEHGSDRIFSDEIFHASLPDIEFAAAFLLGRDVGAIAGADDLTLMERFFARTKPMLDEGSGDEWDGGETERFRLQIAAFRQGLERL